MEPVSPKREFPKFIDESMIQNDQQLDQRSRSGSGSSTHKRSLSGNFFSRFPLLRTNSDERSTSGAVDSRKMFPTGGAMANVVQQKKGRKRKGSLRKVALLGGRDRKGSDAKTRSPLSSPTSPKEDINTVPSIDYDATPRQSYDQEKIEPEPVKWPGPRTSIISIDSSNPSMDPVSSAASVTSPTAPTEASLTDDDELTAFPQIQNNSLRKLPSSSGDSYFPQSDLVRRRASMKKSSLLAPQTHTGVTPPTVEEEWDYSETAFWGYVILIVTWLVFVVGIGSCFDVWSWAWDVGSTPEAPPELEDDPTLPIVGYYPALMVLTAVVAWVWAITAWSGMKYFRHADLRGDDG